MKTRSVILLLFCAFRLSAQEAAVTARIDSTHYRVGDILTVRFEARVPSDLRAIDPMVKDSAGPFEIVAIHREGTEPRWTMELMTVDSGNTFVPPIGFRYSTLADTNGRIVYANPLTVSIAGIGVDMQGEIKDIKPPVNAPWLFEDLLPYLIGLVLLAAAAAGWWYYRKKQKEREAALVPPRPKIPPHKEALSALRLVEDKQLWQQGRVKEYYTEITEILRHFFERRWGIIALELTTDEILAEMKRFPESERVWKELTGVFTTADLVKFAKADPTPADHAHELAWAYEIVRAMIPAAKTVEEEQAQAQEATHAG